MCTDSLPIFFVPQHCHTLRPPGAGVASRSVQRPLASASTCSQSATCLFQSAGIPCGPTAAPTRAPAKLARLAQHPPCCSARRTACAKAAAGRVAGWCSHPCRGATCGSAPAQPLAGGGGRGQLLPAPRLHGRQNSAASACGDRLVAGAAAGALSVCTLGRACRALLLAPLGALSWSSSTCRAACTAVCRLLGRWQLRPSRAATRAGGSPAMPATCCKLTAASAQRPGGTPPALPAVRALCSSQAAARSTPAATLLPNRTASSTSAPATPWAAAMSSFWVVLRRAQARRRSAVAQRRLQERTALAAPAPPSPGTCPT